MIYVTGDKHGKVEINELRNKKTRHINSNDYVIILGDFGLIFNNVQTKSEKYWLDWLYNKPWTTLFVDGNHEHIIKLNYLPKIEMFGGKVGVVNDKLYHLKRGQIYNIEGLKLLTIGGANSVDKHLRTEGIDWWSGELLSKYEEDKTLDNLEKHKHEVDYILTHTCPLDIANILRIKYNKPLIKDPTEWFLQQVSQITKFKKWYFGHWHYNEEITEKYECLYHEIRCL